MNKKIIFFLLFILILSWNACLFGEAPRKLFPRIPFFPNKKEQTKLKDNNSITIYYPEIIRAIPHPGEKKFTQGLEIYHDILYESTGLYGHSSIKKINLDSGKILLQRDIEEYFAEGLTVWKGKIYNLSWKLGKVFLYTTDKLHPMKKSFSYDTEGWGLTHDSTSLIMSDGSERLYFRNPDNFSIEKIISVNMKGQPVVHLNELEYAKGYIYANIWLKNNIYIIDPEKGNVVGIIDTSNLRDCQYSGDSQITLNGIAYQAKTDTFYLTGKYCPSIYEVKLLKK